MKGNKPRKVKAGAIILFVWLNEIIKKNGERDEVPNIRIYRTYCDKKTGKWKSVIDFREWDLPNIKKVIEKYERGEYEEE